MPCLDGRVAIVTGAAAMLGAEIARALHAAGAAVVVVDIDDRRGASVASEFGERGLYLHCDITRDHDIAAAVGEVATRFGGIDMLVNNACSYADRGFEAERDEWLALLNVNVVSGVMLTRAVAPYMKQRGGGVVVNLGSVAGKFGRTGAALYPASKAAILQVTRNEAAQYAVDGIRVNTVSPTWTWSDSIARLTGHLEVADRIANGVVPLGRVGRPQDVAQAVVYLCSPQASFVTGIELPVDGGFAMLGPDQGLSMRAWVERERS